MIPVIPEWFISAFAVATVFVVMFHLGLGLQPRQFVRSWQRPGLMLRALFSVLVAVPAIALVVARGFELPRPAEVGIVLMAIAPGAPIALQRSLGAGGERSFAPGLQVTVALLAALSLPASLALLNLLYGANASASPWDIVRQVAVVQLLPLALGVATARLLPRLAARVSPLVARAWKFLLLTLVVLAVVGFWRVLVAAGPRVALAAALTTVGALAVGHWLGGPDRSTRTVVAITSAARNPGLALLVATLNEAPAGVRATLLTYMIVSAFTVLPYVLGRTRLANRPPRTET